MEFSEKDRETLVGARRILSCKHMTYAGEIQDPGCAAECKCQIGKAWLALHALTARLGDV